MNIKTKLSALWARRHQPWGDGCVPRKRPIAAFVLVVCLVLQGLGGLSAATVPAGFTETVIPGPSGGNWNEALGITFDTIGRIFVWGRGGRVWFKDPTDASFSLLLDISQEVGDWGEHGCHGFAVDPAFRVNGYIYLLYVVDRHHLLNFGTTNYNSTANEYDDATIGRLTRYTCRSSDGFRSVDPASRFILIGETKQTGFAMCSATHGMGGLVFGEDGTLLASCGDGGTPRSTDPGGPLAYSFSTQALADGIIRPKEDIGAFRAQLVDCLNGKVVRIDPATGNGLTSNPYYDAANPRSPRSRVWALGLRNPFRMSLCPESGSHNPADGNPGVLYIGNVGWNSLEALDVVTGRGQNFGWPIYEGLDLSPQYSPLTITNLDAPNPLYPTNGCSQYFLFKQLLKEDTLAAAGQPPFANPCNAASNIPSSIPQFLHARPVLDWNHASAITRTPTYGGSGQAQTANVGASNSPVSGTQFQGNCAIGGTWYTATNFPTQYQNRYFFADWGRGVMKTLTFDQNNKPLNLADFATNAGAVVCMAQHPYDGSLYYVTYTYGDSGTVRKLAYTGNRTPIAAASADHYYGPAPLPIQFSSSGSSDPDGQPITYSWNFGDGTPVTNSANPSHTFSASNGVPTQFVVTLTVTDSGGLSAQASLIVAANDTPPNVAITSPVDGALYSPSNAATVNLIATVSDTESSTNQLLYQWQTLLHHNDHDHVVGTTTNHVTTTVILPIGCDGINIYYYRVVLRVTDPTGLSTTREVRLYPDCGTPDTPPVISAIANQTINSNSSSGPLSFTVSDAETAAANLQLSASSSNPTLLPNGNIAFGGSGTNRTVTVTPEVGQTGTATITVTVNDGPNNTSTNFVLTVQFAPLGITTTTLPNGTVNAAYAATLTASGGTTPYTWSLASGLLSAGLTLNTNTGVINGTPTTLGTSNFIVRVTDASGPAQTATQALSLTVNPAPLSGIIGNTNTGTLSDNIWGSGASINAGRFLAVSNMTVATMRAKVTAISGKYKCAIYSDSGGQPSRLLRSTAEVSNPGDGWQTFPLTTSQVLTNGSYYWLAIWSDATNARVYYSDTSGTLRWGAYAYGPWPDPISTSDGNSFKYCIYAFGAAGPTASSLAVGLLEDTTTNLTLLGGGGGSVSYAILSNPTNGVLGTLNPNTGAVSYSPNLNYNGADTFRFTVSNGSQQATGTVSLTITAVNDAPTLASVSNYVLNVGQVLLFTNSASDTDLPPQSLTFSLLNFPTGATLHATSGVFTWRPAVAQADTTNLIEFKVDDSGNPVMSATTNFTVTVNPLARPGLTALNLTNGEFRLLVTGDAGPDYTIQGSPDLLLWADLFTTNSPMLPFTWSFTNADDFSQQFFRVLLGP